MLDQLDGLREAQLDAHLLELAAPVIAEAMREGCEQAVAGVHQHDSGLVEVEAGKVSSQDPVGEEDELAGEFNPSGAATDNHEAQQCLTLSRILGAGGRFERAENVVSQSVGVGDVFQAAGVLGQAVVADVVRCTAPASTR